MLYKQVRADDQEPRTNVQVSIGSEGGKPVFEPYGKTHSRIIFENGSMLAVDNTPTIGADTQEYFKFQNTVEITGRPSSKSKKLENEISPSRLANARLC